MADRITYWENPLDPAKLMSAYQAGLKIRQQRESIAQQEYERELGKFQTGLSLAQLRAKMGAQGGEGLDFNSIFGSGAPLPDSAAEPPPMPPPMPAPALPLDMTPQGLGGAEAGPDEFPLAALGAVQGLGGGGGPMPAPAPASAPRPAPAPSPAGLDISALLAQAYRPARREQIPGSDYLGIPGSSLPVYSPQQEMMQGLAQKLLEQRMAQEGRLMSDLPAAWGKMLNVEPGERFDPSMVGPMSNIINDRTASPAPIDRTQTLDPETARRLDRQPGEQLTDTLLDTNMRLKMSEDSIRAAAAGRADRQQWQQGMAGQRTATALRKEWNTIDSKGRIMDDAMTKLRAAAQSARAGNATADEELIRGTLQLLEPGSMVRESEFAGVQQLGSFLEDMLAHKDRFMQGGYLTQSVRDKLMGMVENAYGHTNAWRKVQAQGYQQEAEALGIDPRRLFLASPGVRGSLGLDAGAAPAGGRPAPAPTSGPAQFRWDPATRSLQPVR